MLWHSTESQGPYGGLGHSDKTPKLSGTCGEPIPPRREFRHHQLERRALELHLEALVQRGCIHHAGSIQWKTARQRQNRSQSAHYSSKPEPALFRLGPAAGELSCPRRSRDWTNKSRAQQS